MTNKISYAITVNERGILTGRYTSDFHKTFPDNAIVVDKPTFDKMRDGDHRLIEGKAVAVSDSLAAQWEQEDKAEFLASLPWDAARQLRYKQLGATESALNIATFEYLVNNDRSEIDRIEALRQQVKTEIPKPVEA